MRKLNVNRQSGFSLIELMVVVAIIGILATIAVPNFQRFQNRSRQSEAKSNLAALFGAEESFFKLHSAYWHDFRDIGLDTAGQYNYIYGFAAAGVATPTNNFNASAQGTVAAGGCIHNHMSGCGVNKATGAANVANPSTMATAVGALGTAPPAAASVAGCGFTVTAAAPTNVAYAAAATSRLPGATANDVWGINQDKIACNTVPNF